MSFVFPGFLFALTALSIPLIIHLFNFRRFKKIYFTNVRFLREIKEETSARSRLKHLLILASRMLALSFLVLAFAQPFIPSGKQVANYALNTISIYIDNSFSMDAQSGDGSLLNQAKQKAREIISAYNPNDKFQLLTNDFEGRQQREVSKEEFLNVLDEIKISPACRSITDIQERQQDFFSRFNKNNKVSYIISDFQKNMFSTQKNNSRSDEITRFIPLPVKGVNNISVDSIWFQSPVHRIGDEETLIVRIKNYADKDAESIPLKLIINGEVKTIGTLNIAQNQSRNDTLHFTLSKPGWQKGEINIADYPISFDNTYFFSFNIADKIPVLCIHEGKENEFINAIYQSDAHFNYSHTNIRQLDYKSLSLQKLIILDGLENIASGLAQELKKFVLSGGSLIMIPALDMESESYKNFQLSLNADYYTDLHSEENKVKEITLKQDLFEGVFEKAPKNMDLPIVKKYFKTTLGIKNNREVILMMKDDSPLISRYTCGKGKEYLFTVPLDPDYSSLPKHAVFVPLMYKIALLSNINYPLASFIGKDTYTSIERTQQAQKDILKLSKGNFEIIPEIRNTDNESVLYISDQLTDAGIYDLKDNNKSLGSFAFNFDRRESNLSYYSPSDLAAVMRSANLQIIESGKKSLKEEISGLNFGYRLWKWCIALVLLFLGIEVLLLRYFK